MMQFQDERMGAILIVLKKFDRIISETTDYTLLVT